MSSLLLVIVFLPLVGAAMLWAMPEAGRGPSRTIALVFTVLTLALTIILVSQYEPGADNRSGIYRADAPQTAAPDEFAESDFNWLTSVSSGLNIRFSFGLDGLSLWMFALTSLLMVTSVLVSWESIKDQAPGFYALLLLLHTGMLGVFAARDILLFYVFFEFTLIPLFFVIGIWGYEQKRYAAIKFFLYTLAGSVLTFLGLLAIVLLVYFGQDPESGRQLTFSIYELKQYLAANPLDPSIQLAIFLALFIGFAVKVPLFPLHTWLPLAHVQAPTAGSVLLAGVLLKIGTYGFVRFSLPMLPDATATAMPWILGLSAAGIVYGALVALAQSDMKRLIAYSSVSHMGFCMLGLFALNQLGMEGGVLQMINHGISTGGLFAIVGMIYERYHTREIREYGGLAKRTPILAFFMLLFTFSSIGLPGLNGFAGELLLLTGMFQRGFTDTSSIGPELRVIAVVAVSGVVLGAWYMLYLVQRIFFGELKEPVVSDPHGDEHHDHVVRDLSLREVAALAPLGVFIFWIGVFPEFFLNRMSDTLDPIAQRLDAYVETVYAPQDSTTTTAQGAASPSAVPQIAAPQADMPATATTATEAAPAAPASAAPGSPLPATTPGTPAEEQAPSYDPSQPDDPAAATSLHTIERLPGSRAVAQITAMVQGDMPENRQLATALLAHKLRTGSTH